MKKSLIAAAGATLAVSAMPVVGVFAEQTVQDSFTDTVQVTVLEGCIFASEITSGQTTTTNANADRTFTKGDAVPGELIEFGDESTMEGADDGKKIKFYCTNDGNTTKTVTYSITAVGGDGGSNPSTVMAAADGGTSIATNLNVSGATSGWAMKITSNNAYTSETQGASFNTWHVIPNSATTVATGSASTGQSVEFKPAYQVYIGTAQEADTYTGHVTYTLSAEIQ